VVNLLKLYLSGIANPVVLVVVGGDSLFLLFFVYYFFEMYRTRHTSDEQDTHCTP
jgi:hypothetical protein